MGKNSVSTAVPASPPASRHVEKEVVEVIAGGEPS
jgi:hypothetical protein